MTKFQELVSYLREGSVYIQTHKFPDPDAIASAYGLKLLLESQNIASTICYTGEVDRYNALKMLSILDIPIVALEDLKRQPAIAEHIIFIDAQYGNGNVHQDFPNAHLYCIDHHPIYEQSDYRFADIRPEVGACASIIAQYFFENDIPLPEKVATALIYGLKIDTANLSRGASTDDLNMFYHLYTQCDNSLIEALENNSMHVQDLTAYSNAINSLVIRDDVCFANAGSNCPEALIATICDFFINLATVHLSVVYSVKKEGIKLSVRSTYSQYHSGYICNLALANIGSGGGHANMAGGFIPFTQDTMHNQMLIDSLQSRFQHAIQTITATSQLE